LGMVLSREKCGTGKKTSGNKGMNIGCTYQIELRALHSTVERNSIL